MVKYALILLSALLSPHSIGAAEVAITMDDFDTKSSLKLTPVERNQKILDALAKHRIKAGLFVVARNVTTASGKELLTAWGNKGHLIGNHTYSHPNYHAKDVTFELFREDIKKADAILRTFAGFQPFFRFPMAHEGETPEKRDKMRELLAQSGYRNGHITIDASDWYIDQRLRKRLEKNPSADTTPYRDYFLKHIWDRAQYYSGLSKQALGRDIKYNILLHYNLLNALFLEDLLTLLKERGWKWIDASEAFSDPIYQSAPQIVPAGQSLIWALAKQSGKFESQLRFPAEDGEYEKEAMDGLGL